MRKAAMNALWISVVTFVVVAFIVSLTGCTKEPSQLDNCLSWVAINHPELDPSDALTVCTRMITTDPDSFKK